MRLVIIGFAAVVFAFGFASCGSRTETKADVAETAPMPVVTPTPAPSPTSVIPNLQLELLDSRNTASNSPIAKFDFRNYTYELPRGWQNPDGSTEITLIDGRAAPVEADANTKSSDRPKAPKIDESKEKNNGKGDRGKEKARAKTDDKPADRSEATSLRRIGLSLVTTKFFDVTGDGDDEAVVVLKIETGGSAIPQIVHIFSWKDGRPELIWPFRTGDRADGGLKNIFAEGGNLAVELYGQDRFLLGEIETGRISDDLEQICCPTHFTRSVYKWNGKNFLMQGKRLTFATADPSARPMENYGDTLNNSPKVKK